MHGEDKLIDGCGRHVTSLRISLTERCNFRCVYCMPEEGVPLLGRDQHLSAKQIERFVRIIARLGVTRIRLTGGEPLLREDILAIVRSLKKIETVRDLSITTNGSLLKPLAKPLKEAGLDRINISLDSLDPDRFQKVTHTDAFHQVLDAVYTALRLDFPVKLNMVVFKGLTPQEILEMVRMAYHDPLAVRFLEFMPLCGGNWQPDLFIPIDNVRRLASEHFELIEELPRKDQTAQTFQIRGGKGSVGFIASVTEPFCPQCSRIRLSADGKIHSCLFSDQGVSVKDLLERNASDQEIIETIRYAVQMKPEGNPFLEKTFQADENYTVGAVSTPYIRTIGG